MKKKILLLMGIFSIGILLHAQVGINTQNPQGVFHIDPYANTSGATGTADDIIVTADGKTGIGTVTPRTLLDIQTGGTASSPVSGFRLEDGNQGDGNILIATDNIGTATWKNMVPVVSAQIKIVSPPFLNIGFNDTKYYAAPSYIDLPTGRWAMNVVSLISGSGGTNTPVWISSTLADAATVVNTGGTLAAIQTPDIEGLGLVSGMCWAHFYNVTIGSFIVNNQSNATKRYYYVAGGTSSFGVTIPAGYFNNVGGPWGEINIIAYRIPSDEL